MVKLYSHYYIKNYERMKDKYRKKYWDLLSKYAKVFSAGKFDLGRSSDIRHKIHLKQDHPVHKKQFRIPWEHQKAVNDHVDGLLKANCICVYLVKQMMTNES